MDTTLCYLEKDGKLLMLYRNKKQNDINKNKWIGIGGKCENGETPDMCLIREVKEETGLTLKSFKKRGIINFYYDSFYQKMHLYTADDWSGELKECNEGTLEWVKKEDIFSLDLWEGDKYFLEPLINGDTYDINFSLYYKNDILERVVKNMNICVYGAASKRIDEKYYKPTEVLGEKLAERGHTVIFGGGNDGNMGAIARGAHRKKGNVIGIAPEFFNNKKLFFPDCNEFYLTENMRDRKKMLEEKSDAFIVTPGGIGTLDELFEIFTLRNLGRHEKAIVIFNAGGFFDNLIKFLEEIIEEGFAKPKIMECIKISTDADEILDYIENYVGEKVEFFEAKEV